MAGRRLKGWKFMMGDQPVEYLHGLIGSWEIPPDRFLVHNHVRPARRLGTRGFRAWFEAPNSSLEECRCGWAAELGGHYRKVIAPGGRCSRLSSGRRMAEVGPRGHSLGGLVFPGLCF